MSRADTSNVPTRVNPLQHTIARLAEPVAVSADPDLVQAQLKEHRQVIHQEAMKVQ
jgi:hypothetical protein